MDRSAKSDLEQPRSGIRNYNCSPGRNGPSVLPILRQGGRFTKAVSAPEEAKERECPLDELGKLKGQARECKRRDFFTCRIKRRTPRQGPAAGLRKKQLPDAAHHGQGRAHMDGSAGGGLALTIVQEGAGGGSKAIRGRRFRLPLREVCHIRD